MSGKTVSTWAIIIAVVAVLGLYVGSVFALKKLPVWDDVKGIIAIGVFILACGSPVYISIWIDKIISIFVKAEGGGTDGTDTTGTPKV